MTAQNIYCRAEAAGISLRSNGDRLEFTAPKGALTDELRSEMRFYKTELLELLSCSDPASQPEAPSPFIQVNDFVRIPSNPASPETERKRYEIALAKEIMAAAYYNQADDTHCICWAKGRAAWQRLCLDLGGELCPINELPSIDAPTCIKWAQSRLPVATLPLISSKTNKT